MEGEPIRLVVGLGNPGERYAGTRHHVGFLAVDRFVYACAPEWVPPPRGDAHEAAPGTGAPLSLHPPGWREAQVGETVQGGDHTIFVADIVNVGLPNPDSVPLALRDTPWSYSR